MRNMLYPNIFGYPFLLHKIFYFQKKKLESSTLPAFMVCFIVNVINIIILYHRMSS